MPSKGTGMPALSSSSSASWSYVNGDLSVVKLLSHRPKRANRLWLKLPKVWAETTLFSTQGCLRCLLSNGKLIKTGVQLVSKALEQLLRKGKEDTVVWSDSKEQESHVHYLEAPCNMTCGRKLITARRTAENPVALTKSQNHFRVKRRETTQRTLVKGESFSGARGWERGWEIFTRETWTFFCHWKKYLQDHLVIAQSREH